MSETFVKVSVIGLGYIGLPTAAVIADQGVQVVGVDVSDAVVSSINGGKTHIVEPDLDALLHRVVQTGMLRATKQPEEAQAYIIAVPTPFKEGFEPDLTYVKKAAESIAPHLRKGSLVVLESTSPVGTTINMCGWLAAARPDLKFPGGDGEPDVYVAYCPERVLPGKILKELCENDRIIGGMTSACSVKAANLYRIFVKGSLVISDCKSAEMSKLTENAYRDVNIAFANELSLICEHNGIDIWELIRLANHHPRVKILEPGPGVGGHCIAVDPWFIVHSAPEQARIIRTAREINDGMPSHVVERVMEAAKGINSPVIACLGLSYKPDIDDLRESPAVDVAVELAQKGLGEIIAVEPHVDELPPKLKGLKNVSLMGIEEALEKADVAVLLVAHSVFKAIRPASLGKIKIVDTRGIWR